MLIYITRGMIGKKDKNDNTISLRVFLDEQDNIDLCRIKE